MSDQIESVANIDVHIMFDPEKAVGGTQAVRRALEILRLLARHHDTGLTLSELIAATGFERATAYRIATSIVQSGFAERDSNKRYRLGIESMSLGIAVMARMPLLERCRPILQSIARRTEDTVYLVVRYGDYGHCIHREEGRFPIKAFTINAGYLGLLGIGAAGHALLANFSDAEITDLYHRNQAAYELAGFTLSRIQDIVARTRRHSYASTDDLNVRGVGVVGIALSVTPGVHAAISVAAIKSRMDDTRRRWIADLVMEEARAAGFEPPCSNDAD